MTIRTKLILLLVTIGASVSAACLIAVAPLHDAVTKLGSFHMPALSQIHRIESGLNAAIEESFAYVVSGKVIEKEEFFEWAARFPAEADRFNELQTPSDVAAHEAALLQSIRADQVRLVEYAGAMFEEFEASGSCSIEVFDRYESTVDRIMHAVSQIVALESEQVGAAHTLAIDTIRRAERTMYVVGALALAVPCILGIIAARSITVPLERLRRRARKLALVDQTESNHSVDRDEVRTLEDAFDRMHQAVDASRVKLEERVRQRTDELARSEERYRTLIESAPLCIMLIDRESSVAETNEVASEVLANAGQDIGTRGGFIDLISPADRANVEALLADSFNGEARDTEVRFVNGKNSRTYAANLVPLTDDPDEFHVMFVAHDITKRKQAEEQQKLLMSELDHRVRNNLASVLSLSQLTATGAPSVDAYRENLNGRILAMARAHDSLAKQRWHGADVERVIRTTLEPYCTPDFHRARLTGEPINLPARVAVPFALVLNELATNAVKHGALSNSEGRVEIEWKHASLPELLLTWRERGGPRVRPDAPKGRSGLGLSLVRGIIEREAKGSIQIELEPEGLVASLAFPIDEENVSTPNVAF